MRGLLGGPRTVKEKMSIKEKAEELSALTGSKVSATRRAVAEALARLSSADLSAFEQQFPAEAPAAEAPAAAEARAERTAQREVGPERIAPRQPRKAPADPLAGFDGAEVVWALASGPNKALQRVGARRGDMVAAPGAVMAELFRGCQRELLTVARARERLAAGRGRVSPQLTALNTAAEAVG
jgi:hypothetical protein